MLSIYSRFWFRGCWLNPGVSTNLDPSLLQLGSLGEHCKLPSGVWGRAPAANDFVAYQTIMEAFFGSINVVADANKELSVHKFRGFIGFRGKLGTLRHILLLSSRHVGYIVYHTLFYMHGKILSRYC